jgi:hypothetical protein
VTRTGAYSTVDICHIFRDYPHVLPSEKKAVTAVIKTTITTTEQLKVGAHEKYGDKLKLLLNDLQVLKVYVEHFRTYIPQTRIMSRRYSNLIWIRILGSRFFFQLSFKGYFPSNPPYPLFRQGERDASTRVPLPPPKRIHCRLQDERLSPPVIFTLSKSMESSTLVFSL